jgi:aminocarboxymuconate-semialdehyde decarboxylase
LQLIACHGGGAFPYLAARFDIMWERTVSARKNQAPPSTYLNRLWYDSIVYDQQTLDFLVERVGADRVLYGSDYPFSIGDMKGVLARVDALPAAQRDAIRSANAERLFDLS